MAKIPENLDLGNVEELTIEDLSRIISDMYKDIAVALNKKAEVYTRNTDGQASDISLGTGSININKLTQKVEILVDRTATTVTWKTL